MINKVNKLLSRIKDICLKYESSLKMSHNNGRFIITTKHEGRSRILVEVNFFCDEGDL